MNWVAAWEGRGRPWPWGKILHETERQVYMNTWGLRQDRHRCALPVITEKTNEDVDEWQGLETRPINWAAFCPRSCRGTCRKTHAEGA